MLLLQEVVVASWVGTTVAISLLVIALAFVTIAAALTMAARQTMQEMRRLSAGIESLRAELSPALVAVQAVSGEGQRLAGLISSEAEELVAASRSLRKGLQLRLANLEAVYEVLEEEVEETALQVAVTLRHFRTGADWVSIFRRLLRTGRRR
jgi:hypothetical protein